MRFVLPFLLWLIPLPAVAAGTALLASSSQCDAPIARMGLTGRLPGGLLMAIAQVESGRPSPRTGRLNPWPWTINAEGTGEFFANKSQAIAAVKALWARGVRSIDVGCMQINLAFHPDAFRDLEQAFDPDANARYAVRFLNVLFNASHDWKQAIAAYHSSTPSIGADYRRRVMALWHNPNLSGWGIGLAVAYRDFPPQRQLYSDFLPSSAIYGAFAQPAMASMSR